MDSLTQSMSKVSNLIGLSEFPWENLGNSDHYHGKIQTLEHEMRTDPGPLNTFQVFLLNFIQFKKIHYTQGDHFEWATLGPRKLYIYNKI